MIPNELENCEICKEQFKEPKQLPCRHSFCRACLQQQISQLQAEPFLSCWTCGTKIKPPMASDGHPVIVIDHFPDDNLISSLIQFEKMTFEENGSCSLGINVECVRHPEKYLKYYCDDCSMPICQLCKDSEHQFCQCTNDPSNIETSDSFYQFHLQRTAKSVKGLAEKVAEILEIVQNQATDLFRKRTEMQIEISAYFSRLRTKMNEHLCKLEKQLRSEYDRLLNDQTEMNKEYLELAQSFNGRCNSVKELVAFLYNNDNAADINKKMSLIQILSETRIAATKDAHVIDSVSSCWQDKPRLEFLVDQTKEERIFCDDIARVEMVHPSDNLPENTSPNTQTPCENVDAVESNSPTPSTASNEYCVPSENSNGSETGRNSASSDMGQNINDSTGATTRTENDNEEDTHTVPSLDNTGMSVFLPTAPPMSDSPNPADELPPPYTPGIVGETLSRPTPRPSPLYLIDPHDPPPPYPGLPCRNNRNRSSNNSRSRQNIRGRGRNQSDRPVVSRSGSSSHRRDHINVQLLKTFNILKESDRAASSFLRILWVNSKQFLVVDRWNSKVRLFSQDGTTSLCGAAFKGAEPWDITAISEREYGVTFPKSKTLCMICLSQKPDLVITGWKNTPCGYICLTYFRRDNVFVCGSAIPFSDARVDIISYNSSQSCTLLRSFQVDPYGSSIFQYPRSVKITEGGTIIVSDYTRNCVMFVSLEGFVFATYEGSESSPFQEPMGISVDPLLKEVYIAVLNRGTVHGCTSSAACIHRVTMEGNVLAIIPKDVGLDRPKEISVFHASPRTVKLLVTKGNGMVQLFKLGI